MLIFCQCKWFTLRSMGSIRKQSEVFLTRHHSFWLILGSELVFIAKTCSNLKSLRVLIGDKTLMGESNLCYDLPYFRKVEKLIIEGSVHLHAFVFLWGHCRALKFLRMGSVVSNNGTSTNVLVYEVFTLLLQVILWNATCF